ncbi:MAG TPA: hypothetical protein VFB19_16515 [Mycobacterium sp.]|nr:hypothetical protein [Mycobacterium sp.]
MTLQQRLKEVLDGVVAVTAEDDGALTVRHDGTLASLRVVSVADDLELVSLSQILAWDVPMDRQIRARVAAAARDTMLGTVTLVEKKGARTRGAPTTLGEVLLRYNFPGSGLTDDALRTLIMMVLSTGADVRRALAD